MAKNLAALRNKNRSRPRKGAQEKARRTKVQRARLTRLGMAPEAVAKLNAGEVRTLLKRPAKIKPAV
jgi:hypothetical protein